MNELTRQRVQEFLTKWQGTSGNERANKDTFFLDLCEALGVERPPAKGSIPGDPYCFEKDIKFLFPDGQITTRFADFYKAGHFIITITGMYNLLEKLKAGQPFSDADRIYNDKALVSTLKQIHDELDTAVLDAYGWEQNISNEEILNRLVALNAERAAEERNGLIRWLRPEYQAPTQTSAQMTLAGITDAEEIITVPVEQKTWPKTPKDQLAAIRDLLRTTGTEWTAEQVAAQFKGASRQKKTITQHLESLEWFGILLSRTQDGISRWHYAELRIAG